MSASSGASLGDELGLLREAAARAGEAALKFFRSSNRIWTKQGGSPVSEADYEADRVLREILRRERPDYGWLSEESEASRGAGERPCFVIDPIDGTRAFIDGGEQWCVSAALVWRGRPLAAVLDCPAMGRVFAAGRGGGATLDGEPLRPESSNRLRKLSGPRRLAAEAAGIGEARRIEFGAFIPSLAYRIALAATGEVDAAFAEPRSREWDVAAADLILEEAGGALSAPDGKPLRYEADPRPMPALLAAGPGRREALLSLARSLPSPWRGEAQAPASASAAGGGGGAGEEPAADSSGGGDSAVESFGRRAGAAPESGTPKGEAPAAEGAGAEGGGSASEAGPGGEEESAADSCGGASGAESFGREAPEAGTLKGEAPAAAGGGEGGKLSGAGGTRAGGARR